MWANRKQLSAKFTQGNANGRCPIVSQGMV